MLGCCEKRGGGVCEMCGSFFPLSTRSIRGGNRVRSLLVSGLSVPTKRMDKAWCGLESRVWMDAGPRGKVDAHGAK